MGGSCRERAEVGSLSREDRIVWNFVDVPDLLKILGQSFGKL